MVEIATVVSSGHRRDVFSGALNTHRGGRVDQVLVIVEEGAFASWYASCTLFEVRYPYQSRR
jgi:hypothetical protein